jgi:LysR family transcriptional regulator, glycine cleavage system transcriptional activator
MYAAAMQRPEGPLPLPPLGALRAFEAAARLSSFTRAAEELCVTQTAVSHQVRLLEETLGEALFVRRPRRIELTERGSAWARALSDAFGRLYEANRSLRARAPARRPVVSVSVLPSFASRWLVPRLGRFLAAQPEVDLRISPSSELVDLNVSELDLGIRFGTGRYPGLKVERLCADGWIPACAPGLKGRTRLKQPSDLAGFRLLHDDNYGWRPWLAARNVRNVDAERGPVMTDSSMVVEAALSGQGVGLVRLSLVADELALGRLINPFPRIAPLPTPYAYYLALPRRPVRPEVRAFCDWVRQEITALRALSGD